MHIDCDFPSGNILVDGIDGDTVRIRQDLRDTVGDWFYWHFRVRGAQGRTVRFQFTQSNPIGVRGPCISANGGADWRWLGMGCVEDKAFTHSFSAAESEVHFAFCIPYTESNLREFLSAHRGDTSLHVGTLCKSQKGREIELLRAGKLDGDPQYRVLLTGRQHSCEAAASFVLEGMFAAVLDSDELGRWFQANAEVMAIPFMDKDGVEDGDQGKNRSPHDHNRDFGGESLYPSVGALRRLAPDWSGNRLRAVLDLHCPWIRGGNNECIYIVGTKSAENWRQIQRFGAILERDRRGELLYASKDNLPFGEGWNTYDGPLVTCQRFGEGLPGVGLSATVEFPYANVREQTVTPGNARAFGRDLAAALRTWMMEASQS